MKREIRLLTSIEVKEQWPRLREHVASLETPDGYLPEDVYLEAMTGNSVIGLLMVDEFDIGFAIFKGIGNDLHIWQLKTYTNTKSEMSVMIDYRAALMNLARTISKTHLTFGSTRPGWNKIAPTHGFKLRMAVFECPIDPVPDAK